MPAPRRPTVLNPIDLARWERALGSIHDQAGRLEAARDFSVGSAVHYARWVEFGTRRMPARPFLRTGMANAPGAIAAGRSVPNAFSDPDRLWAYLLHGDGGYVRDVRGRFAQTPGRTRPGSPEALLAEIGEAVVTEAQRAAVGLGAWDTGTMTASVAWGGDEAEMLKRSRRQVRDYGAARPGALA